MLRLTAKDKAMKGLRVRLDRSTGEYLAVVKSLHGDVTLGRGKSARAAKRDALEWIQAVTSFQDMGGDDYQSGRIF